MTGLPGILLLIACLLVMVSAVQPLARRLLLPSTVLLAAMGILIGGGASFLLASPDIHAFDRAARVVVELPISSDFVLTVFLPILVFAGALELDVRRLAHDATTVGVLAVVAVGLSTAAIGFAIYPFAGASLAVCLMLGAIVANTDPSAVTAIFRDIGAASRLTRLVEGEALLNDAAAISLFTILLAAITGAQRLSPAGALVEFVLSFAGAVLCGVVFGRLTLLLIARLGENTAGDVTLTLALPFIAYVVAGGALHLSGVVAVAASGLTISALGPSTLQPRSWRFVLEMWEQLAFWAGSLVFVLASMLVPRLLLGLTWHDAELIGLAVAASLVARAAVLFGILPVLARLKLSRPVPGRFKVTILWGGLRGAITLALALAVTENEAVSAATAHLVATCATGFVLVTLLVNGTTLRPLVVWLGLDRLSAADAALRHQVLAIGLSEVRDRTRRVAGELGFAANATEAVMDILDRRIEAERERNDFDAALTDSNRISLALLTLASRERTLLLELFRLRGLTRGVIAMLLRTADAMVDGARYDGRLGYLRAVRRRLRPSLRFRLAQALHRTFRWDAPLMREMTTRYEVVLVSHLLALALTRFMRERVEPMLGARVAEVVSEILVRRQRLLGAALEAMRLHHGGYTEALESRVLRLLALRYEADGIDALLGESLVGEELHAELIREMEGRRRRLRLRLRLDLRAGIDARVQALALFRGLPEAVLHEIAMRLSIRLANPGEELIRRGERPRTAFLVSSGALELHTGERDFPVGAGEEVGAAEILHGERMAGSVRCLAFSHLLEIRAADLRRIADENPGVRANLERLRARRAAWTLPHAGEAVAIAGDLLLPQPRRSAAMPPAVPGRDVG